MSKKILIDGSHNKETRVAVVENNRIHGYDYESPDHKPLRGNIYLAKIMRVEPSLQAAFVDFGGNRHGFLAFSEIHPDYFQIPIADREALLKEVEEEAKRKAQEEDAEEDHASDTDEHESEDQVDDTSNADRESADKLTKSDETNKASRDQKPEQTEEASQEDTVSNENQNSDADNEKPKPRESQFRRLWRRPSFTKALKSKQPSDEVTSEVINETSSEEALNEAPSENVPSDNNDGDDQHIKVSDKEMNNEANDQNNITSHDDDHEAQPPKSRPTRNRNSGHNRSRNNRRQGGRNNNRRDTRQDTATGNRWLTERYSIQEVVKRGQIMLIQVVKEERGNKGAALTTYLSFAGRYSVLMPNTARGCGVSRKINKPQDRKRLKEIASELKVPSSMGVILRTAGATRTKDDIQRDFEYLALLWDQVRSLTMESVAPSLVYEEGSLIKRTMRDVFDKSFSKVLVEGDDAYKEAKSMMALLDASQVNNIERYKGKAPIFTYHNIEKQIDAMYSPTVNLPSGGYIVINQTEALVAIDINSGKATREHNIEAMALSTNLEAAEEICRQLKLRDLAGLIVIDFIDMDERRNNRAIESRLKEHLRFDRARTQAGSISNFGLLEMSRQRQRTGLMESSSITCPTCNGAGHTRSPRSLAIQVLRGVSGFVDNRRPRDIIIKTRYDIALTILNQFRDTLSDLEMQIGAAVHVEADNNLDGDRLFRVERLNQVTPKGRSHEQDNDQSDDAVVSINNHNQDSETRDENNESIAEKNGNERNSKRRNRRGGNRNKAKGLNKAHSSNEEVTEQSTEEPTTITSEAIANTEADQTSEKAKPKQRRKRKAVANQTETDVERLSDDGSEDLSKTDQDEHKTMSPVEASTNENEVPDVISEPKSKAKTRRPRSRKPQVAQLADNQEVVTEPSADAESSPPKKPRRRTKSTQSETATDNKAQVDAPNTDDGDTTKPAKPRQRKSAKKSVDKADSVQSDAMSETSNELAPSEKVKPKVRRVRSSAQSDTNITPVVTSDISGSADAPKRSGWWQKN